MKQPDMQTRMEVAATPAQLSDLAVVGLPAAGVDRIIAAVETAERRP